MTPKGTQRASCSALVTPQAGGALPATALWPPRRPRPGLAWPGLAWGERPGQPTPAPGQPRHRGKARQGRREERGGEGSGVPSAVTHVPLAGGRGQERQRHDRPGPPGAPRRWGRRCLETGRWRGGGAGPSQALSVRSGPARFSRRVRESRASKARLGPTRSPRPRRRFPPCYSPPRRYRREAGPGFPPQEPRGCGPRSRGLVWVCGLWDRSRTKYESI